MEGPLTSLRHFLPCLPPASLHYLPRNAHVVGQAAAHYLLGQPTEWKPDCVILLVETTELRSSIVDFVRAVCEAGRPTLTCCPQSVNWGQAVQVNLVHQGCQARLLILGNPYPTVQEYLHHSWLFEAEAVAISLPNMEVQALNNIDQQLASEAALLTYQFKCEYNHHHDTPLPKLTHYVNSGLRNWTLAVDTNGRRLAYLKATGHLPPCAASPFLEVNRTA